MKAFLLASLLCTSALCGAYSPTTADDASALEEIFHPNPSMCFADGSCVIQVHRLPIECITDSQCEALVEEMGCQYSEDTDSFLCNIKQYELAIERHWS